MYYLWANHSLTVATTCIHSPAVLRATQYGHFHAMHRVHQGPTQLISTEDIRNRSPDLGSAQDPHHQHMGKA